MKFLSFIKQIILSFFVIATLGLGLLFIRKNKNHRLMEEKRNMELINNQKSEILEKVRESNIKEISNDKELEIDQNFMINDNFKDFSLNNEIKKELDNLENKEIDLEKNKHSKDKKEDEWVFYK